MRIQERKVLPVRFVDLKMTIPNIYELEKIGAGHDGIVFRYGDLALKLLKYDVLERKEKNLMSYDKANYFSENLHLERIITPIDTMLDADGVYTGYVMNYIDDVFHKKKDAPHYKEPGSFMVWDLLYAIAELEQDFSCMTKNHVMAKDINRGSYLYSLNFMYICDTDKYIISKSQSSNVYNQNISTLNFTIAKFLFYEMQKSNNYDKNQLKALSNWVKKACNSRTFLIDLNKEIGVDSQIPIREYTDYKVKQITK